MNNSTEVKACLADVQNGERPSSELSPSLENVLLKSLQELSNHVASLVTEMRETNHLLQQSVVHTSLLIDEIQAATEPDDDDSSMGLYLDGSSRN